MAGERAEAEAAAMDAVELEFERFDHSGLEPLVVPATKSCAQKWRLGDDVSNRTSWKEEWVPQVYVLVFFLHGTPAKMEHHCTILRTALANGNDICSNCPTFPNIHAFSFFTHFRFDHIYQTEIGTNIKMERHMLYPDFVGTT